MIGVNTTASVSAQVAFTTTPSSCSWMRTTQAVLPSEARIVVPMPSKLFSKVKPALPSSSSWWRTIASVSAVTTYDVWVEEAEAVMVRP